jgi:hypothetical protein
VANTESARVIKAIEDVLIGTNDWAAMTQVEWMNPLTECAVYQNRALFSPRTLRKGILFSNLLSRPLSGQGLFDSTSLAWLQEI